MKEFKPESILIRLSVERSAARLAESEMRRYQIEKVKNAEMLIEDPEFIPEFTDDLTGDLLEMAWDTIKAGIETARAKHYANVTGKKKQSGTENPADTHSHPIAPPMGTHRPPNTYIHSDIHSDIQSNIVKSGDGAETDGDCNPGIHTLNTEKRNSNLLPTSEEKKKHRFLPPTLEEVSEYCKERNNRINPEHFIDYYQTRGWELKPGQKVKDWKACIRTWEQNIKKEGNQGGRYSGDNAITGTENRTDYSFLRTEHEEV